ncbi:MAG TPA: peptidoglycan-associated lipoprotein Pal [Alphaproteobacteria bacterium]
MIRNLLLVLALAFTVTACSSTPDSSATSATDGMTTETNRGAMNKDDVIFDQNGQAQAGTPGSQEDLVAQAGDRVFFALDSSDLSAEGRATLEKQAQWLKTYANTSVTIEGHCDERGTREYNLALGERRANSVKNYLVSLGVDASRVNTISYGKERPAVTGADESSWAQNRRGVTVIN